MSKKFNFEISNDILTLEFEHKKAPYVITLFGFWFQSIALIFIFYFYENDIPSNIFIATMAVSILMSLYLSWYLAWAMLSRKKLELTFDDIVYSRELFNKIKSDRYKWSEIENFIRTQHKGFYFLTIKKMDGEEISFFNGVTEEEITTILAKINDFKSQVLKRY